MLFITAVTNNTRRMHRLQKRRISLALVDVNQRKTVKIILDSDKILSRAKGSTILPAEER